MVEISKVDYFNRLAYLNEFYEKLDFSDEMIEGVSRINILTDFLVKNEINNGFKKFFYFK